MTSRSEHVRIFEIKSGPVDVRTDAATGRVCFVFESKEMDVKLFRTMSHDEALAFVDHITRQLKAGAQ